MGKDITLFYDAFDAYMKGDYQKAFDSLEDMKFIAHDEIRDTKDEQKIEELNEYIRLVEVLMVKLDAKCETHDPKGLNEC